MNPLGRAPVDMVGAVLGRLTFIARAGSVAKKAAWLARCSCGATCTVVGKEARAGRVRSCGCLRRETAGSLGRSNTRHGATDSPTWRSWKSMRERCTNRRSAGWRYWGGRGISVCDRWASFELFASDMGPRPSGKVLDRIDNDGDYEPGNCRWATVTESNRNKRPGGRRRTR